MELNKSKIVKDVEGSDYGLF